MSVFEKSEYSFNDELLVSAIDEISLWSAPFGLKLLDTIRLKEDMSVLDIGCGLGFPAIEIAARLGGTGMVYGLDPWREALKRAELKSKAYRLANISFIEGKAEQIPLPDNSIDLIVSNNGINNVQDLTKTLSECRRVARKGAQFTVTVNLNETMTEFYSVYKEVLNESGRTDLVEAVDKHIYSKRLPEDVLVRMIMDNGFTINSTYHDSFKYSFASGSAMFRYPFIRYAFLDSWLDLPPREIREQVFSDIEKRLNKEYGKNGLMRLTIPFIVIDCGA